MVLSDVDIKKYMANNDLEIKNFSGALEPASYDLRVGDQAVTDTGIVNLKEQQLVEIPRGSTVIVYPMETIKLSTKLVARYGLRSGLARRGLILLSGPQVDPGFEGVLSVTMFNAGTQSTTLVHGQAFATLEFAKLVSPASRGYSGPYQHQSRVSEQEAEVVTRRYRNFTEIDQALTDVQSQLQAVTGFVNTVLLGLVSGIVVTLLGGLILLIWQAAVG